MTTTAKPTEIKLTKKVQKVVLTKAGLVNLHFLYALQNSRIEGNRIYPKRWANKGRTLIDYSLYIERILEVGGYKIRKNNTAPRGGSEGDCYILSKRALQLIENIKNYNSQFK